MSGAGSTPPMPAPGAVSVDETLDLLRSWFAERFGHLRTLADELIAYLGFDAAGNIDLSETTKRKLKAAAVRFLADNETVDGCGLIFAHSALGTENGHLEWWVREDESRFARYSFGVVPGADRYYDYEQHEWFIRAFHEGTPALVGPYIDYLGVEAYVMTLTVPAEIDGRRVGAVGNDMQVEDLERALMPLLLRSPVETVLLGRHGTVLFGNTSRFLPGDWVPPVVDGFTRVPLEPLSSEIQLLVAAG
ncbi:cache domain-containing protein [Leucobacter rhizosphaerae]|uniref:Cache domain-containing protein n=1 Tax=Leucobacter rhizosphaerae TaxID=2932245 RepID=A0ABY4FYW2_9MICO|nr:cache domain-containing protein [Leucobacter rhizosphaerae]UOQ61304.1 cache domain-containing protein [Leucobacter rhizosphaerae]